MSGERVLKVENLSKTFRTKAGEVSAVRDVSFEAEKGEVVTIIGPSGSGKTTLLYLIGSLEAPDSGVIEISGKDVAGGGTDLVEYRRGEVGFVFQFFNLISALTALENVELPMDISGKRVAEQKRRAAELLEHMGIDGRLQGSRTNRISGGEKQRVAIARALANDPQIILADEPTGNLDSDTGRNVVEILRRLAHQDGKCVVIVTHDEGIQEFADRAFQMVDGRLESL